MSYIRIELSILFPQPISDGWNCCHKQLWWHQYLVPFLNLKKMSIWFFYY